IAGSAPNLPEIAGLDAESRAMLWNESLGGDAIPAIVEIDGRADRLYAVQPITNLLGAPVLAIGFSRTAQAARLVRSALLQAGILLLSAGLAGAVAIRIGQQLIRRPIKHLVKAAERVGSGELTTRLGPPYGVGEFGTLSAHFDSM